MVLWKKESTGQNACYVDLVKIFREEKNFNYEFMKLMYINKNADKSTKLRTQGNQQFKAKNWKEAMNLYNKSLCYAPNDSENISLAYANRSLCFFQLKKYDQCLVDIELAKKANYPQRLMSKLEERKAACLKLMNDEPTKTEEQVKPVLSFDANEKFPDLANVLEIRSDDDHKKHIVATSDIDVGQIVMLEEMYITNIHSEEETFCKTCLRCDMNYIPCRNCSDVMFCDDNCMASHKIHEMTCNVLQGQKFDFILIVESILVAVMAFPNVGSFMEFVESSLAVRDYDIPVCNTDVQSKYRSFLKLDILADRLEEEMERVLSWSYRLLSDIPDIKQSFRSKEEKRVLMHLITQHQLIFVSNGTLFHEMDSDTGAKKWETSGLCITESFLNRSCTPNVCHQRHGNKLYVFVLRPVKAGDELFIDDGKTTAGNYRCKCGKCVPRFIEQADVDRMKSDEDIRDVLNLKVSDLTDAAKRTVIKATLENLLRKYGSLPWTPEFDGISLLYDHCMRLEYYI